MILILISIGLAAWLVSQLKAPECLRLTLVVAMWALTSAILQTAIWAFTDTAGTEVFWNESVEIVVWSPLIAWVLLRASRLSVLALLTWQTIEALSGLMLIHALVAAHPAGSVTNLDATALLTDLITVVGMSVGVGGSVHALVKLTQQRRMVAT